MEPKPQMYSTPEKPSDLNSDITAEKNTINIPTNKAKNFLIGGATAALFAFNAGTVEAQPQIQHKEVKAFVMPKIIYETSSPIPDSLKKVIIKVVTDYQRTYGTLKKVCIADTIIKANKIAGGGQSIIDAHSEHEKIFLNLEHFTEASFNLREFRDIIAHELSHTLTPSQPTMIKPFEVEHGRTAKGYIGLNIMVNDKTFTMIDEAAAEALSVVLYRDYEVQNETYFRMGNLMIEILGKKWLTVKDLQDGIQTNDVPKIIGLIMGVKKEHVTPDVIISAIKIFNECRNAGSKDNNAKKFIDEIEKIREKNLKATLK